MLEVKIRKPVWPNPQILSDPHWPPGPIFLSLPYYASYLRFPGDSDPQIALITIPSPPDFLGPMEAHPCSSHIMKIYLHRVSEKQWDPEQALIQDLGPACSSRLVTLYVPEEQESNYSQEYMYP